MSKILNNKPDIVHVVSTYLQLRKTGKSYIGICPFHEEKTPSFVVSADRQRFHCFGCGTSGDVISFIQKLKKCEFKQALTYLKMKPFASFKENTSQTKERKLVLDFREWCNDYFIFISTAYRLLNKLKLKIKTPAELEKISELYHYEPIWEYHMNILSERDEQAKLELFLEVAGGKF